MHHIDPYQLAKNKRIAFVDGKRGKIIKNYPKRAEILRKP